MLTTGQAYYQLKDRLSALYDSREAETIAHDVMEHITGLGKMDRLMAKDTGFTPQQAHQLQQMETRLLAGTPMQYVLGYSWFMGRRFSVCDAVLIPRPETEELVEWITTEVTPGVSSILDVGTGSGCIPVTLKLTLPDVDVTSVDISPAALTVASANAATLGAAINFLEMDFLVNDNSNKLPQFDIIVSNPPYIPISEKDKLDKNVRDFEPELALFVPDNDPLVFYRAIALFGHAHLNKDGAIYCEMESTLANACGMLYREMGYNNVEVRRDMHGNLRMLKAVMPG